MNPAAEKIRALYAAGVRRIDIEKQLNVTANVVSYYLRGMPSSKKPKAPASPKRKATPSFRHPAGHLKPGYRLGCGLDIPKKLEAVIATNIKGNETIIACLCRLVIQQE